MCWALFIKKRRQHRCFYCEYCEIPKNTYFEKSSTNGCFWNEPLEVLYKKIVLENVAKFTCKQLCLSLLFDEVIGLRSATLIKKDSDTYVFL